MREAVIACSSRASSSRVAVETYFFGTISATAMAVTMAAANTITNALRRARSASRNCWKSMCFASLSLEQRFFDVDHIVGLDRVVQLGVGLHHLAVGAGAAHLQP